MRRLLATQRYTNGSIAVLAVENEPGIPHADTLLLRFCKRRKVISAVALRPDEVVATISILAKALHEHIVGYRWKAVRRRKRKR